MNFAMAALGLKEMGKFLWEGTRKKSLPIWLSQFSFAKLRQPTGQNNNHRFYVVKRRQGGGEGVKNCQF